jgi:hypothetical protein
MSWLIRHDGESPMEIIRDFMDSERGNGYPCKLDVREFANEVFPLPEFNKIED